MYVTVPYQACRPQAYEKEAARLKEVLSGLLVSIHHIGSTAVPGLAAKPIIDILPVVTEITAVDGLRYAFAALSYEYMGEFGIPGRRYLRKGGAHRTHQVHIFGAESQYEIERHLAVRDYLRMHPLKADAYAALKRSHGAGRPLQTKRADTQLFLFFFHCLQRLIRKKHGNGAYGNAPPLAIFHFHVAYACGFAKMHACAIGSDHPAMGFSEEMKICLQRNALAVALHKRASARNIRQRIVGTPMQKPHKIFIIRANRQRYFAFARFQLYDGNMAHPAIRIMLVEIIPQGFVVHTLSPFFCSMLCILSQFVKKIHAIVFVPLQNPW